MSLSVTIDVADLAPGQTRAVSANGRELLVCNAEGRLYAIENRCPHAMVRLDAAVLSGCILECPVHGGRIDVRDGSPQRHPIRRPSITYPVRGSNGRMKSRDRLSGGGDFAQRAEGERRPQARSIAMHDLVIRGGTLSTAAAPHRAVRMSRSRTGASPQ